MNPPHLTGLRISCTYVCMYVHIGQLLKLQQLTQTEWLNDYLHKSVQNTQSCSWHRCSSSVLLTRSSDPNCHKSDMAWVRRVAGSGRSKETVGGSSDLGRNGFQMKGMLATVLRDSNAPVFGRASLHEPTEKPHTEWARATQKTIWQGQLFVPSYLQVLYLFAYFVMNSVYSEAGMLLWSM